MHLIYIEYMEIPYKMSLLRDSRSVEMETRTVTFAASSGTDSESVRRQFREASENTNSICQFLCTMGRIFRGTTAYTTLLCCLFVPPVLMFVIGKLVRHSILYTSYGIIEMCAKLNLFQLTFTIYCTMINIASTEILGIKYVHRCPAEPLIPVYLIVSGLFGIVKIVSLLMMGNRRQNTEFADEENEGGCSRTFYELCTDIVTAIFNSFLIIWFVLGNYWVFSIYQPPFERRVPITKYWCASELYIFALTQIFVCYVIAIFCIVSCCIMIICFKVHSQP